MMPARDWTASSAEHASVSIHLAAELAPRVRVRPARAEQAPRLNETHHHMKITDIRACQPKCDSPPDWRTSMGQILVAIDTDVGVTGYGVGGGGLSAIHIVRTVLRDVLLGRAPGPVEALWDEMYRATLPFG